MQNHLWHLLHRQFCFEATYFFLVSLTDLALELISRQIEIKSRPSGAEISFDGEKIGRTPITINKPGGIYEVQVSLNNYLDISDEIEITRDNGTVKRDYFFELKKGKINFTLEPKDGLLLLNGIDISNKKAIILDANVEHELTYSDVFFPLFQSQLAMLLKHISLSY